MANANIANILAERTKAWGGYCDRCPEFTVKNGKPYCRMPCAMGGWKKWSGWVDGCRVSNDA